MSQLDGTILVTGGAGFIGSHLVEALRDHTVIILDKLTYAACYPERASEFFVPESMRLFEGDICDRELVDQILDEHRPKTIFHLAAESHVDRSIGSPAAFVRTNVQGTATLLEACLPFWQKLSPSEKDAFRFIHVSTDEVFGALDPNGRFNESSPYQPNSPYSASKAGSDHLVRAWFQTFGLPAVITNCSNNYGPRQHQEKLIPTVVSRALAGEPIPIYGTGENVRDWLYVKDHVEALLTIASRASAGSQYCIGGGVELSNLVLAQQICQTLDRLSPRRDGKPHETGISFVKDRLGHDFRYAIDSSLLEANLGWSSRYNFKSALDITLRDFL